MGKNYVNSPLKNNKLIVVLILLLFSFTQHFYAQCSGTDISGTTDMTSNWASGDFTYSETNVDGTGVDFNVAVTGETGVISTIVGGSFNGINGVDLRSNGFTTGATFTFTFSSPVSSVTFDIAHINTSGGAGDLFTVSAIDGASNTIAPTVVENDPDNTFTTTINPTNAVLDATTTSATIGNANISFSDPDGITSITIVWDDCTICTGGFHGSAIGDMQFCVAPPDLQVTKTSSPTGDVNPGDVVTYTIEVENIGTTDAYNVEVEDLLPSGVTYVSGTAEKTYPDPGIATATYTSPNLGPLSVDNTGSVSFDTTGLIPADAVITSYSFSVDGEAVNGSFRSEIDVTASYPGGNAYVLDFGDDLGLAGSPGTYSVTQGPNTSVSGTAVGTYQFDWSEDFNDAGVDNQISNLTFTIEYEYSTGATGTVTDAANTPANMVIASDNITLEPGETLTVTFDVIVNPDTEGTTQTNTANISIAGNSLGSDTSSNNVVAHNTCTDTQGKDSDGDGINDICDFDDDNDGIFDGNELGTCTTNNSTLNWDTEFVEGAGGDETLGEDPLITNPNLTINGTGVKLFRNGGGLAVQEYRINDFYSTDPTYTLYQKAENGGVSTHIFEFDEPIYNLGFTIYDVDEDALSGTGFIDAVELILTKQDGTTHALSASEYTLNGQTFASNTFTGQPASLNANVIINGVQAWIVKLEVRYRNLTTAPAAVQDQALAFGSFTFCNAQLDTDNDGTPDYLDTDSDDDGCFDALEAAGSYNYTQLTSGAFTGVDGNGVPTTVGASGQATTAAVTDASDSTTCCDATISGFTDTDGDNLVNICDVDDDNDGLLDVDERPCFATHEDFGTGAGSPATSHSNVPAANVDNVRVGANADFPGESWYQSNSGLDASGDAAGRYLALDNPNGSSPVLVYNETITVIANEQYSYMIYAAAAKEEAGQPSSAYPDVRMQVKDGLGNVLQTIDTGALTLNWQMFEFLFTSTTTSVTIEIYNNNNSDSYNTLLLDEISVVLISCDSDSDGIPDYLDTDSDNDGCPDAIEGDGGIIDTSLLVDLTGGSVGGSIQNLGSSSDAEGNPIVSGSGFEQGVTAALLDDTISIACTVDVSLTKTVSSALPKVGDSIVYTLTVKNDGLLNATGINVTDVLPAGLTYSGVYTASQGTYDGGTDVWTIGAINIGETKTLDITVTVSSSGTIINTSEVTQSNQTDIDSLPNNGN